MRTLLSALVVSLAAAPALAVTPPVSPPQPDREVAEAFVRATRANDLAAYGALFASGAKITTESGAVMSKDQWLAAVAPAFSGRRTTKFLAVTAGRWGMARSPQTRAMFVTAFKECPATIAGCYGGHRSEVATIVGGKIVALEATGSFSHRLEDDGVWTWPAGVRF